MIHMFVNTPFLANDNTFTDLINSGSMDIFIDGKLKFELLELYTLYRKIKAQEAHIEDDNRVPNGFMICRNNHPEFDKMFTEALNKNIAIDSIITSQMNEYKK